jgi:conjugation system TraG family ATPase
LPQKKRPIKKDVTMSRFLLDRNLKLLEPYEGKLSRTVLRGERGSNAPDLPGKAIAKEGMAEYIKYLFKTVRKFFGEAIVVTQEVDDIIQSPIVKESIINNSDCKILLDQRKYMNKFDSIQAMLGLTDKEKAQVLSINMANNPSRKYKEVWIGLGGVQSAVYATEVSLEEYYTYTTEETEKLELFRLSEKLGGNIELAIKQLAESKRSN